MSNDTIAAAAVAAERSRAPTHARQWAVALLIASGFAGLGYQIVWTQQSALWLGHETAAVLAVVAAFFGGLAVGALALGSRIDRSAHPARWYAACEAAIGVWGLALAVFMKPVADALVGVIGNHPSPLWHWTVAFGGTFVLLLPATAAMGATLPAMERLLASLRRDGTSIAALYAGNTFGAVLGTLGAAFVLAPTLGFARTAVVCAAANLVCAIAALACFPRTTASSPITRASSTSAHLPALAVTGLLGIGYEVLVVRVLSQIAENTVYTFALLLAVYLVGTAVGAASYSRWHAAIGADQARDRLLRAQTIACLLGVVALAAAPAINPIFADVLGDTMAAALAAEAALAIAAFLLPTIVMGALFSHLMTSARTAGIDFGRSLGVNTIGAAIAPLVFGVLVLPAIGPRAALIVVAAGYLALTTLRGWRDKSQWLAVSAICALAWWSPALTLVTVPEGGRVIRHVEGASATVSVVENAHGVRTLHINNRQQEGSNVTLIADGRQALLASLLHPAPQRALFLGLGTGVTARTAATDPTVQVDAVELLPEVIEASKDFTSAFDAGEPPLRVFTADSRRYVRTSTEQYDVIVADNFHPARSGSGSLYTIEHFAAVRHRLAPGGLFCQWLPLHQLDLHTLRSIVRSFLHEYPHTWAMLATNSLDTPVLGLIARNDAAGFDTRRIRRRLADAPMSPSPAAFGIPDDLALLGSFVAGPSALSRFAAAAPLNTDDHPVVMYDAPRITYAADSLPRDRLIALLAELTIEPRELLSDTSDAALHDRLAAYWTARDRFIAVGRNVAPSADAREMLAQVREPLLEVLRISPEFRPAYDPLVRMATELARVDGPAARALLLELAQIQQARPEALEALQTLP